MATRCEKPQSVPVAFGPEMSAQSRTRARLGGRRRWVLTSLAFAVVLVAVVIVVVLFERHNVRTLRVVSGAMEPSIAIGTRVEFEMGGTEPLHPGEVVLFHPPNGAEQMLCGSALRRVPSGGAACSEVAVKPTSALYVKRVVAGPGDTISIREGRVIINGKAEREPYIKPCGEARVCDFPTPVKVVAGTFFLLGDNRGESNDSRFWGPVPRGWITGHAVHCSFFKLVCSDAYTH
jgi:signal peptidase I